MVLVEAARRGPADRRAPTGRDPGGLGSVARSSPAGDWPGLADALEAILARPPTRRAPPSVVAALLLEAAAERYAPPTNACSTPRDNQRRSRAPSPPTRTPRRARGRALPLGGRVEDSARPRRSPPDRAGRRAVRRRRRPRAARGVRARDRAAARHRLERRLAEALVERREDERRRPAVEADELVPRDDAARLDAVGQRAGVRRRRSARAAARAARARSSANASNSRSWFLCGHGRAG